MNSTGSRIIGTREDISCDGVHDFFEQRANRMLKHKYNYVLYLDSSPEIAIQRDQQAKQLVEKQLRVEADMKVLDIGCGLGRWGEFFCPKGTYYVGIDGCAKMIEMAHENLAAYDKKQLVVGDAQELARTTAAIGIQAYDIIFLYGILMYLNDETVKDVLTVIGNLCHHGTQVCFIESMSVESRLTLKEIFPEEMGQKYSAIYRTPGEFKEMMLAAFDGKLSLAYDEWLEFPDGLQKKHEHVTMDHCLIWDTV